MAQGALCGKPPPDSHNIDTKNSATASRLIKEALSAGVVRLSDPNAAPKMRRYVPRCA
ncbi:hypothetical protein [Candidatus Aalborgicola defluviihabitans]|uniref:hypothetical protein n=1 Tax=Candidatus Aalborgicola defluviihabitans TaxID=3386187 RepID=UPI001DE6E55E|nr:hypothetical protein [Burkholderiales bacterium]